MEEVTQDQNGPQFDNRKDALKSPAAFFDQVQKLERARTKDNLNRAIHSRPERDKLVQMHILEDTSASNAIVAHQKDLKKAQLVDDLNDKIALRPGVIELVERNIIQANEPLHEALKGGHLQYKKISDLVDEDSNEALSPEQVPPPPTSSPPLLLHITTTLPTTLTHSIADRQCTIKNEGINLMKSPSSSSLFNQNSSHPYLSRQLSKGSKLGQSTGLVPRINQSRKKKDKPKFKKFKYHQYIPPDQNNSRQKDLDLKEHGDTPYSRLLEQQQLYLQLQIMNKQYSTQLRSGEGSHQSGGFSQTGIGAPPPPSMSQGMKSDKPPNICTTLTLNKLDEMKVSELKEELKYRRLKVTGTKEVLVERLKPFCVDSDNLFMSEPMSHDENSSSSFQNTGSPTAMNEGSYQTTANDKDKGSSFNLGSSAAFTTRVARMPVPEQHKIILKQDKFTMPTWHSNIQDARVVSMVTTHPSPVSSFSLGASRKITKDKLLEEQQKEIHDLRKMVELHRSQLQLLQDRKQMAEKKNVVRSRSEEKQIDVKPSGPTTFEFPTQASNTQPSVQFCSSNPTTQRQTSSSSQPYNSPPNYDQAFELMNEDNPRSNHERANRDMDALLELLADQGELPCTPITTRLNDHPVSYTTRLNDVQPSTNHHGYHLPHQTNFQEYGSVIALERAQLQKDMAHHQQQQQQHTKHQSCAHRGSRDFTSPDLTKMLVESAGDVLMDTSSFPPVINSAASLNERGFDQPLTYTRHSARNSVDSGIIYSNSHYSPMDTNLDGSSKDIFNDLRLSSSSLDSGEPTLNTISLSPATPPRPKPHLQSAFRQHPSPRSMHNHLVKSASQELLSTNDNPGQGNHLMDNELSWLDLTLSSAMTVPGSPGGPFSQMSFEDPQAARFNSTIPYQNYNEFDPTNISAGGSTGTLNINHGLPPSDLEQFDLWDGVLGPNFPT